MFYNKKVHTIIKSIYEIKPNKWNLLVENHPNGNIFQTTDYLHLHTKRFNSNFFGYAAIIDGKICGVISGVIFYNYFFPFSCFTRRAIVIGGPLIDGNDLVICKALLRHLITELKNKAIYIQFRNLWDMECYLSIFEEIGFTYEPHLDILHDLSLDIESIKSKVSKNKRGNINKSINKGLLFYEVTDGEEYKQCVDLVIQTYKRIGLPCFEKKYFLTANELLGKEGLLKTFAAKIDDTPCICGRQHLRINQIIGRDNEVLLMPSGRKFIVHNFTGFFQTDAKAMKRAVDQFQIIKQKDNSVLFKLVVNAAYDKEVEMYILDFWQKELGVPVYIEIVKEISIMQNNKRRFIIND